MKVCNEYMSEAERLVHNIVVGVAVLRGISHTAILSRKRGTKAEADARHLAMRRLYDMGPEWSMPRVARAFKRKDHTTVLYALKKYPEGS